MTHPLPRGGTDCLLTEYDINKLPMSVNKPLIIAIDGPSGSGKSTLGRMLARALHLLYIDTGSMYRAIALSVLEAKVDPEDYDAVVSVAQSIRIDFQGDPDAQKTLLAGRDVSELIRSDSVTNMSSVVSAIPG